MASVELRNVKKVYRGGVQAVRDVSLQVAHGELLTLVGPSGCGKSTTLNLIAGLESPSAGTVLIDGEEVQHRSPRERDVAMVFQSYALYPHMDVRGNLGFPLKVSGLGAQERESRILETASMLGLEALLSRKPKELSGGQRQRVALGRALVRRPKVFLFDEPLSNLDAALRSEMRAEIKRLHQRLGATFIYVTHDQAEAMTLSDRVVVMNRGAIEQVAPPREIYERPCSLFVAQFFGSPRINVVLPRLFGMEEAPDVRLAFRPEHVEVLPQRPDGVGPGLGEGTLSLIEPMGSESWVTVDMGGERVIARTSPEFTADPGARLWLVVQPAKTLRFRL